MIVTDIVMPYALQGNVPRIWLSLVVRPNRTRCW